MISMEMLTRDRPWTYEDYLTLPDDGKRYEIIDGALHVSPAPLTLHQALSKLLQFQLFELERAGLGWVFNAPFEVVMPGASPVQPDLVFVLTEQREIIRRKGVNGVPALLVEILSPSTARYDRVTKLNRYARCGVPHYWLLEPDQRVLEVFRLDGSTYRLLASLGPGDTLAHPEFPGLVLDVDRLYEGLPPGVGPDDDELQERA